MDNSREPPPPEGSLETRTAEIVLATAELWYPVVLLFSFIISAGVYSVVTARTEEELLVPAVTGPGGKPLPLTKRKRGHRDEREDRGLHFSHASKRCFQYVTLGVLLTFVTDAVTVAAHAIDSRNAPAAGGDRWWCGEERIVYVVGSAFLYLYVLITLFDWSEGPNVVHFISWCLGLLGETTILLALVVRDFGPHYVLQELRWAHKLVDGPDDWDYIDIGVAIVRVFLMLGLVVLFAAVASKRFWKSRSVSNQSRLNGVIPETTENTPLLNGHSSHGGYQTQANGNANGNINGGANGATAANQRSRSGTDLGNTNGAADAGYQVRDEEAAFYRPSKLPHKTWYEYCIGYKVFFPYLWPSKMWNLQVVILFCFILVVCQRYVNIMVPLQLKIVTNAMEKAIVSNGEMPLKDLAKLILFKFLQGPSGFLGSLRSILWVPVSQHTFRSLTSAAFEHVHSLSLDFHLGKRTGEVLSALNKGGSVNQFLEQVTFQVVPMLFDLLLAIFFFQIWFGPTYALFVTIITFYYLFLTIRMAATRADQRRDMVNAEREEEAVKNESITSYETVKYFNAEQFEFDRYRGAIKTFQDAEAKVTWGINQMNVCQSVVFMFGMLVCLLTCAFEVSQGTRGVPDFVMLITYLGQLQGPLNFFGTFYRTVQQAMISGERLLELFKIQPTVIDMPSVQPLENCTGHIRWNNVKFAYDRRRPALRNLSFECLPGTTTAFVGESGGGKSTVFRLMFRYYNCKEGSIEMDGYNVKDLTIDSVRSFIGVVPQDTILFNDTLMYNLKYANQNATDEDVYDACRAAAIHDRILSFPDGYETKVGERGLRLSGGEKQRVAIARTILKNPKVIMLDEATSALDGETEQKIQRKLISGNFGQDRTLLIIAHRLSTITHADQIIVLHAGTIAEKGTHEELLAMNGRYATMWEKHCRAELAAEEARAATNKAEHLLRQANILGAKTKYPSDGYNSMASSAMLPTDGATSPADGASVSESMSSHNDDSASKKDEGSNDASDSSDGSLR